MDDGLPAEIGLIDIVAVVVAFYLGLLIAMQISEEDRERIVFSHIGQTSARIAVGVVGILAIVLVAGSIISKVVFDTPFMGMPVWSALSELWTRIGLFLVVGCSVAMLSNFQSWIGEAVYFLIDFGAAFGGKEKRPTKRAEHLSDD